MYMNFKQGPKMADRSKKRLIGTKKWLIEANPPHKGLGVI